MAQDTPENYRNLVIYEIYVRNHSPNGSFSDVLADLERIQSMGVDIIWFMPIHPIGVLNKKGSLGCPYSISNYREINPAYGTKADFSALIARAHQLGLKVMIDVVYNHTSHDSVLVKQHPEWFHQDESGKPVTTVPEWSDVIDLKHPNPDLSAYLIRALQQWAAFGVDGFRCDVASLLPLSFWKDAREAVAEVKPGVIWLAESVQPSFVEDRRMHDLFVLSECEIYTVFDLAYEYDIWPVWQACVKEEIPTSRYLEMLRFQNSIYPENYVKMRYVENHDQPRVMGFVPDTQQALAWTAFSAFNKGAFLIYAGQESGETHRPSLFDIDKVNWQNYQYQDFLTKLARLKKHPAQLNGKLYLINDGEPAIQAMWHTPKTSLFGLFNVKHRHGEILVFLPDGVYTDLISNNPIAVKNGKMALPDSAAIIECAVPQPPDQFFSSLINAHYEA